MTEEKKEGFSYSSPEVQKKSALTLFITEVVAGAVVVALILGVLNYFNVFPLSKMAPNQFGWLPQKSEGIGIRVASQVPGVRVVLQNQAELVNFLTEWGVIGKPLDWGVYGSTSGKELKQIELILVKDEIQENATVGNDGKIFSGSRASLQSDAMTVSVYIAPEILNDSALDSNIRGISFLAAVVTHLYRVLYPLTIDRPNPNAPKLF